MENISKIQLHNTTYAIKDLNAYVKPSTGIPASDIASGVIPDVSNFITNSVNDLVNYYLKSDTYTKTEVADLIGAINQFHYEIAASTSAVDTPASNVLYLIGPTGSGSDQYEEYVYASDWVKIGDTSIDLSGYITTQALNTALADYQTKLVSGTNIKTVNNTSLLGSGNVSVGTITGITMNGASKGTSGVVNLGTVITSHQDISGKVDKVSGKGLSTNDYTTAEKEKLAGVASNAQVNVLEGVKVNGTAQTITNKTVDISVPTALSQLSDDATHRVVTDSEKTVWDGKYTKPSGGIPASDLASGVIPDVSQFIPGTGVTAVVALTESEYAALVTKNSTTLYIVKPDPTPEPGGVTI